MTVGRRAAIIRAMGNVTLVFLVCAVLDAAVVTACPVCWSDGGETVRAGIAAAAAPALLATVAPFAVLVLLVRLVARGVSPEDAS
jgi:hypothetical protein